MVMIIILYGTSKGVQNVIDNYVGPVTNHTEALGGRSHFFSLQGATCYLCLHLSSCCCCG